MEQNTNQVSVLSEAECLRRLGSQSLGRVVTRVGEVMDIFPVNYVLDEGGVVFRTAEGTKLAELVIGGEVLFEVDQHTDLEAWSVVVRGAARVLESEDERLAADRLPLRPLVPTMKRNYVRIDASSITGRAFELGEEPSREGPHDY